MSLRTSTMQKIGDMSQYAGYRHIQFRSGRGKGVEAFEAYNAAGLSFTVLPDKCLDLFKLSYKGVNLSYISKNGLVSGSHFNALDGEFEHYWSAGMLSTCGLENTGPACMDNGSRCVMHGRLHMIPAEHISSNADWEGDDFKISFRGEMRQSVLWGMHLRLQRHMECGLYGKEIMIRDTLENLEPVPEEFCILYHCNFGYPLLDEGTRLVKPRGGIKPRDAFSIPKTEGCFVMEAPDGNIPDDVFFHENPADGDGFAYAGLINDKLKLGAYLKYSADTLPVLSQWKCRRPHDYVMGLEPGNSYIMGRKSERENRSLKTIGGYEKLQYTVIIGILDGEEEIRDFEHKMNTL